MEDEMEMFFDSINPVEGYIKSRAQLTDVPEMLSKLDTLIMLELELAIMGAEKAKSEILKKNSKNNIKPLGVV